MGTNRHGGTNDIGIASGMLLDDDTIFSPFSRNWFTRAVLSEIKLN